MKENNALVSVVVPVYNAGEYLARCVESVLGQTYKNLELFLVDDGSTDGSGHVCDIYARKDARVKVMHTPNGGLSAARNRGIKASRGNLLTFLDADDFLHFAFIKAMVELAEESQADIACCTAMHFHKETPYLILQSNSPLKPIKRYWHWSGERAAERMLEKKFPDNSAWGKLYRRSLFSGMQFEKGMWYEDLDLIPRLAAKAKSVAFILPELYYYRQHPSSYLHNFSLGRLDALKATERLCNYFKGNEKLERAAQRRRLSACFNILGLLETHKGEIPPEDKEKAEKAENTCREYIRAFGWRKGMGIKNRLGMAAYKAGLYRWLAKALY